MSDSTAFRGLFFKRRKDFLSRRPPPTSFEEVFGLHFAHLWNSYDDATGIFTDTKGGFNVDDGGTNTPPEAVVNGHVYPVFNGVNNGLSGANLTTLDGLAGWTIWGAFKTNNNSAFGAILDKSLVFYVELTLGAGSMFIGVGSGGGAASIFCTRRVDDNAWHRFVVTCNNDTVNVYIDGVLDGTDTGGTIPTVTNNLLLGVTPTNTVTDSGVSVVGIATRGATATEVGYITNILLEYTS